MSGSTTTDIWPRCVTRRQFYRSGIGRNGPDAVEQLGSGDEWNAKARGSQQHSPVAGIVLHVVDATFDRADSNGVGDKIGLQARLDDKQSADLAKHRHGKPNVTRMAAFRHFPIKDSG